MKRLVLHAHKGLGDLLLINGLIRTLVERDYQIKTCTHAHNAFSGACMFADLYPKVLIEHEEEGMKFDSPFETLVIGCNGENFDPNRWDESFYRQAGVPFLAKWEKFYVPDLPGIRLYGWSHINEHEKIIVHDDAAREFVIPVKGHRIPKTDNIFDHYPLLMRAHEIHCINSCVAILADFVCEHPDTKLFLHRYARPDGGALPIFGREWTILDKPL